MERVLPAATVTQFIQPDKAYTDEGDEKFKHGVPGAGRDGVENEKQQGLAKLCTTAGI